MSTDKNNEINITDLAKEPLVLALVQLLTAGTLDRIGKRVVDEVIPDDLRKDAAVAVRTMAMTTAIDLVNGEDERFRMGLYATFLLGYVTGRDGCVFNDGGSDDEEIFEYAREQLEKARARVKKN